MTDFLLELRSEEIPARMQVKAKEDLARLFAEEIGKAGLKAEAIETFATPRRLALIARGLPDETAAVREETKGPKVGAPPQALEGFLRKTGLTQGQLEERDGVFFAVVEKPGRGTAQVLAEAVPAIVRAFPWPKSMRWGVASASTESLRWVRPLQGIVALFGDDIVDCEVEGIRSGATTLGHRFHHPGPIAIGGAHDYVEKLREAHVIVHLSERTKLIREGAEAAARAAGLSLVEDEGLVLENAGLTEWPVPLLGRFDAAFLDVPREVIQLTMRTNQKYFACVSSPSLLGEGDHAQHGGGVGAHTPPPPPSAAVPLPEQARGGLANAFVCTANIDASDGGNAIVAGNERVLSARLSDAKFFWENDLKVPVEEQAAKLKDIVFHEKLGTVADKVERVAKLARWLCKEGIIHSSPERGGGARSATEGPLRTGNDAGGEAPPSASPPPPRAGEELADLATRAARLCKADLVTGMVGEFPELQGVIGGHLARAQGEDPRVAAAIRDHYKPVGQGDDVPTDPVTVAVSLADKLDTLSQFFLVDLKPTGSKDPFALRRAAIGIIEIVIQNDLRFGFDQAIQAAQVTAQSQRLFAGSAGASESARKAVDALGIDKKRADALAVESHGRQLTALFGKLDPFVETGLLAFLADRLKVQQREAGVRHDLIDAVFALGGEDDLVRLLSRVKALQAFVETREGADLLAGYKRAANILKKEGVQSSPERGGGPAKLVEGALHTNGGAGGEPPPSASPPPPRSGEDLEPAEAALIAALDAAEPRAVAAIDAENFEAAMSALATLRVPIDAFFESVTVNDADPAKRANRLALLARFRDAVHRVADFSKIEG